MQYRPVFEDVAAAPPGGVLMASVNVTTAMGPAAKIGVQSLPTTVFLKAGKEVNRVEGALSKAELLAAIAKLQGGGFPGVAVPGKAPAVSVSSGPVPVWGLVVGGLVTAGAVWWSLR